MTVSQSKGGITKKCSAKRANTLITARYSSALNEPSLNHHHGDYFIQISSSHHDGSWFIEISSSHHHVYTRQSSHSDLLFSDVTFY
jgi:hypothetical protein